MIICSTFVPLTLLFLVCAAPDRTLALSPLHPGAVVALLSAWLREHTSLSAKQ